MDNIFIDVTDVTLLEIIDQVERLIDIYGESAQVMGMADMDLYIQNDEDRVESDAE